MPPEGWLPLGQHGVWGRRNRFTGPARRPAELKLCGVYQPIKTFEFNRSIRLPKLLRLGTVDWPLKGGGGKKTDRQGEGSGQRIVTFCAIYKERTGLDPMRRRNNEFAAAAATPRARGPGRGPLCP